MNKFIWLILLILWILLGLFLCRKYLCNLGGVAAAAPIAAPAVAAAANSSCVKPWKVKDGSKFSFNSNENITFLRSSSTRIKNNNLNDELKKTADYLKANNKRALSITGYYDKTEKNNSILSNLGLARANDVKGWLTSLGVPSNQLELNSVENSNLCYKRSSKNNVTTANGVKTASNGVNAKSSNLDTLNNGISFVFGDLADNNSRLDAIKQRLLGKPVTVYFQTNSDNINLNAQQRKDFSDLIYYLDNVSSSKLNVGGHTDNVGDRNYNVNLSKDRADFVKKYLQRNAGIGLNRMDINGFGPDKPIATNNTTEGKAKNRRVEVTLK